MFLSRPRFWLCSLGVLLVAALGHWGLSKTRPLARLDLPDGKAVLLQSVTYEKVLRVKTPPPPGTNWWGRIRHWFSDSNSTTSVTGPGPTFLFSRVPRERTGVPKTVERIRAFLDGDRPFEARLSGLGHLVYWADPVFPRREKTFRVQIQVDGAWHDWELPNPLYGQVLPTWKAEEFPIKRVIGDIEYTNLGWRKGNFGPYLKFELRYQGKKVDWPVVSASSILYADPGGNLSNSLLSTSEPAWKVRHEVITGRQAPLGPKHKVTLPKMKLPDGAPAALRRIEGLPFKDTTTFFGIAGPGSFCFVDGKPFELDAKGLEAIATAKGMSDYTLQVGRPPNGTGFSVFGSTPVPVFLLVRESPRGVTHETLEHGYWKGKEWKDFRIVKQTSTDGDTSGIDAVALQPAEPMGTEIDVDLFWHERFTVEMFVKPPPPELGPPNPPRIP